MTNELCVQCEHCELKKRAEYFKLKDMPQIYIINGTGGSGKDTFVDLCREYIRVKNYIKETNKRIYNFSTIDLVKLIAKEGGWNGGKTEKDRKFLSDLKDLLEEYNNAPNLYVEENIEDIILSKQYGEAPVFFIHVREPKGINYFLNKYPIAKSLLIINANIPIITSNHADAEVLNFDYDYIIDNSGDFNDLEKKVKEFCNKNILEI